MRDRRGSCAEYAARCLLLSGVPRIDLRIRRTRINECHTERLGQSASDLLNGLAPVPPHGRQGHRLLVGEYQFDLEYLPRCTFPAARSTTKRERGAFASHHSPPSTAAAPIKPLMLRAFQVSASAASANELKTARATGTMSTTPRTQWSPGVSSIWSLSFVSRIAMKS